MSTSHKEEVRFQSDLGVSERGGWLSVMGKLRLSEKPAALPSGFCLALCLPRARGEGAVPALRKKTLQCLLKYSGTSQGLERSFLGISRGWVLGIATKGMAWHM